MKEDVLEALVGKRLGFFGVDNNQFKLGLYVYEAIEDESDGYRSYLGSIELKGKAASTGIFFKSRIAMVTVKVTDQGYALVDDNNHVWLEIGTDNSDEYYPQFVFRYNPKRGNR